jgi:hypothetical protein
MDVDSTKKSCSFCGEQGREDVPLVGGLGAFMCGPCVDYYAGVVAEIRRTGEETPPPWETMSDPDILGKLALIVRTGAQVDRFLVEWVQLARSRKLSWAEIGKALGVSRQAAWERFARAVADDADAGAAQAGSA